MQTRKIQVKSLLSTARTSNWKISKGLIKPDIDEQPTVQYWTNIHPPGIGGGIILQKVFVHDSDIDVEYYYSDIYIITLMALGIIGSKKHEDLARNFIAKLLHGDYHDKIKITKMLFVKPASTEHLLSVMGLNSRFSTTNWRYYMRHRNIPEGAKGYLAPTNFLDAQIKQEIAELCVQYTANK